MSHQDDLTARSLMQVSEDEAETIALGNLATYVSTGLGGELLEVSKAASAPAPSVSNTTDVSAQSTVQSNDSVQSKPLDADIAQKNDNPNRAYVEDTEEKNRVIWPAA